VTRAIVLLVGESHPLERVKDEQVGVRCFVERRRTADAVARVQEF